MGSRSGVTRGNVGVGVGVSIIVGDQKQVKRASDKLRFDCGANVRVHPACGGGKHLLFEARPNCRDNLPDCIRDRKKSGVEPPHSVKERGSHGALRSKGRCGDGKHSCELVAIRG